MRVIWKGLLYSRRCLPNLISKRGSIEQGKFLLSSQESMLSISERHTWSKFNVSLFVFHIPKWGGVSPWDSIGSYLEWRPSAHNGNANWATKCGKNSPRVKYVCTGKSPACQISLLYHSLFRFCCYTAGYLCFCGRLFMHCQLSRNSAKKLKYGSFPLIEFRYHHILKSGSHDETLIGCYRILVQSGNRQNGRVGTFPCHSQDGSMRLLASAPWQRCTTNECRLIGLLQMEMAIAYNPIPACFVKGGNLQNTLFQVIWRNSQ